MPVKENGSCAAFIVDEDEERRIEKQNCRAATEKRESMLRIVFDIFNLPSNDMAFYRQTHHVMFNGNYSRPGKYLLLLHVIDVQYGFPFRFSLFFFTLVGQFRFWKATKSETEKLARNEVNKKNDLN